MVLARILEPDSKLATTRWWHITTLPSLCGVADADEDDLYEALDWLLERQERIDIHVRPIRHRLTTRVRAHIFLCMLAYYVQWHMPEAWRPLLFCDEDQQGKTTRDPVAPAKRSAPALRKVHACTLDDGTQAHSFRTLLKHLSAIVRNVCRLPDSGPDAPTFDVVTTPDAKQQRAFDLLENIHT